MDDDPLWPVCLAYQFHAVADALVGDSLASSHDTSRPAPLSPHVLWTYFKQELDFGQLEELSVIGGDVRQNRVAIHSASLLSLTVRSERNAGEVLALMGLEHLFLDRLIKGFVIRPEQELFKSGSFFFVFVVVARFKYSIR